ncbi:amino acid ABC transporter permease [Nocardioides caeni]|uniref:Amino acid ABC transporter permease n=1 Tax=Nocardioides caeni TaxID=574700 RepID=A0A4S8NI40_9ACTN|nr:amino acid ABC transporter permease [Nocardioides caeni]THV14664.1 amino acid ABC transporter permease [Nocardioides caeni]
MDVIIEAFPDILQAFWLNIRLALYSGVLALVLGTLLAAFRVSPVPLLRLIGTVWVNTIRNTPLTLVITFMLFGLSYQLGVTFSDTISENVFWLAVVGLGVYTAAFVCEVLRAGINTVDVGQSEAARSLGFTFTQNLRLVILPQAFRAVIAPLGSTFIALIKNTTIAVVIGVTTAEGINESSGLMRTLIEFNGDQTILIFAVFALGFVIITLPIGLLTSWAAKRLGGVR